ncbi:tRNA(adenine(34)) deaminase, chloroplastic [Vigna radiata var. radiata]|uniref:tRNA(adenine(34)) deaminase n=1 Tax=Vigna radiata var. radiata TaxID=3916 RepID=A0A1S3VR28_VIGRR|nr:tRNA(adenine(34)) deaminase, chloroplastic [Vigna radiata var. radiata]XP_022631612.1 tRNA(adenine(34)) deaminase, chloroplastic [Vigna radiata var. radiata]
MYNAYVSPTVYAVRCRETFSLSFNGYSNFCHERFDGTPSYCLSCCGCCDCCSASTYRVPVKSCLVNGLRQSALLQLSATRRLILGGGDHYLSRLPAYGFLRDCQELNSSVNEKTICNISRRSIKGRCIRVTSQKGRNFSHSFGPDDVEAVLSLLNEEADREATICSKCKDVFSSKRMEAEKARKSIRREGHLNSCEKVKSEKAGNLKQHQSSTIELRREYEKPNKEREDFAKSENHRKRRNVSSGSSYYSLSSGDFGSELEAQDEIGLEELSLEYEKGKANGVEEQVKEQLKEEFKGQGDDSKKLLGVSNKDKFASGEDIDWNLRKKTEKKLTQGTLQNTESTREQQDVYLGGFKTHESGHERLSVSQDQVNSEEDKSSFVDYLDKKTNKLYLQTVNRRKHQSIDVQESDCNEVEKSSLSQKELSGREGKLEISEISLKKTTDEREKIVGSTSTTANEILKSKKAFSGREGSLAISETLLQETNDTYKKSVGSSSTSHKDLMDRSSLKYTGNLRIEDSERTSNTKMKGMEMKNVLSSVQGVVEEQQHQKGEKIITQANVEDTSILKSRTRLKNMEENLNISSDSRGTWLQTDKRTTQSFQHRKGSEFVGILSEGYASDEKQVLSSQKAHEKVKFISKSKPTSVVRTRESSSQTDGSIANLSISDETTSREESSLQGSLNLVSGYGKHVMLEAGEEGGSATMLIPSSSEVGGGSAHVELTAGIANPNVFLETSKSGSSALSDNSGRSSALHPDALGSANLSEKSSRQFVDEFAERIRHEVTTSKAQEMEVAGPRLTLEVGGNQIYNTRQQGTKTDVQSKEHDSSRSSGFPGTKGPSDEIWDVSEPSIEQGLVARETETSKETGKTVIGRTGRSLWGIISDIVRLRWGSRAGSSTSAGKSAERNSPNKSESDTWFSGQEHEETTKTNVVDETSVLPQAMISDKLKLGSHSHNKLKDKGKHLEIGSSSPNTLESGSVSVGASYTSGEENASWNEDNKDLKATNSGTQNMELPISIPARGPPIAGEIVSIGGSDMSGGAELVGPVKDFVAPLQSELSGSERKDGELKQRKLQRNKQVLRDRFDDWEEAYQRELEQRKIDEMFMKEALLEAKKAADTWEVPVGAVLVQHGKIIARGCNLVEELRDSTAHAEMICIREASNLLRTWRLSGTTLYVTLEPCPMCAGAILQARIDTLVWGAPNKLLGADGSWIRLFPDGGENASSEPRDVPPAPVHPFHPKMKIRRGVLATECADAMQQFFQLRRKTKKEETPKDPSCLPVSHHHPSKILNKIHDVFHIMFCL